MSKIPCRRVLRLLTTIAMMALISASVLPRGLSAQPTVPVKTRWVKGNTHAHTLRSDGDSTHEEVTKWYRDNGYNVLFITDHETITPVEELNKIFGKAGEFVIFTGQEVTDRLDGKPYHVNGLGVDRVTLPQRGKTVVENLQLNIDSVRASGGIARSEERRVGKECRSRWSQYH